MSIVIDIILSVANIVLTMMAIRFMVIGAEYKGIIIISIILLLLFVHPIVSIIIAAIICLIFSIQADEMIIFSITELAIMFLGWIPALIFIVLGKRPRAPQRMSLTRQRTNQQPINRRVYNNYREEQIGQAGSRNENKASAVKEKINVNLATSEQIRSLTPLITVVEANKIIQERDENGNYKNARDLQKRSNLSTNLIDIISQYVSFEPTLNSNERPSGRVVDF